MSHLEVLCIHVAHEPENKRKISTESATLRSRRRIRLAYVGDVMIKVVLFNLHFLHN